VTTGGWSWDALARSMADSLQLDVSSRVAITTTGRGADEAVAAFVHEVYRRGGNAQVVLADTRYDRYALADAAHSVLGEPPPLQLAALSWSNVFVAFRPMAAPDPGPSPDAGRLARQRQALGQVSRARWRQRQWSIVRVPTPAWADATGMSYDTLLAQFRSGSMLDWPRWRARWAELATRLAGARQVRIQAPGTNLTLGVGGRCWVPFAGEHNLPDGELATAPVENSAEGTITFPGPFWFADTEFRGLSLRFAAGRVAEVTAEAGLEAARAILSSDQGASRIGELGLGLNARMTAWTGDLFFDEKILGTVHLALGRGYPECGGVNESAVHWDIVLDLRPPAGGGSLLVDGRPLICGGIPQPPLTGERNDPW
jgi:aminopeptidase